MTRSDLPSTRPQFAELSQDLQARVDQACDKLESAWLAVSKLLQAESKRPNGWPDLAEFVAGFDKDELHSALHELIPIDVSYRRRLGAPISAAGYSRFADLDADWLGEIVLDPEGATRSDAADFAWNRSSTATEDVVTSSLTAEQIFERVAASGLLAMELLERERSTFVSESPSATELAERWIARELLTPFQLGRLLQTPPEKLVLGEYLLLGPLGRGGMGTVYKARHRRMDRIVAIKVLPQSSTRDPHVESRFRREIRAVARLSHPHIVAAHDAGEADGVPYLVMECIDGLDLSTWVRRHGPLSVAEAVECVAQAADGMEYAHQQGIIHRDLKPSNLLMSRQSRVESREHGKSAGATESSNSRLAFLSSHLTVKVLDLGLARFDAESPVDEATAVTRSGMIFGTAEYMAPEQAINVRLADRRSDIYSLGCTLFFLLTGRPVVRGETYMEMVMAHQMLTLPALMSERSDVPSELDAIFRRMTARNPDERFASMREVYDALRAITPDTLSRSKPGPDTFADSSMSTSEATDGGAPPPKFGPHGELATHVTAASLPLGQTQLLTAGQTSKTTPARFARRQVLVILAAVSVAGSVWLYFNKDRNPEPANSENGKPPQPLISPANAESARSGQQAWAKSLNSKAVQSNTIGMNLVLIPPGEFLMGTSDAEFRIVAEIVPSPEELESVNHERPARRVRLTKPFWMGETEVTFGQFQKFVTEQNYVSAAEEPNGKGWGIEAGKWILKHGFSWRNLGDVKLAPEFPASNLTWNDAVAFCIWLSKHESEQSGRSVLYRLPTETEWEFACRAGSETPWYFGSDSLSLAEHAINAANSNNRPRPVKSRAPNPFGLFDLYGNESEWCADRFAPYEPSRELLIDPVRSTSEVGPFRVQRGGSFGFLAHRQRSASREGRDPESPMYGGFRIVREQ